MNEINELNSISETDDRREVIKNKLRQYYDGRIVRKDLTKSIREGANVPVYVLEYLLGQYCNSDDQEIIDEGIENVKRILRDNYVRPDEAQKIMSLLRERGSYTVIDRISVILNTREPEARIAICKCKEAKGMTYGVRFQRANGGWKYTWAFKMKESSAKREGYDNTQIMGNIYPDDSYPGCPYCSTEYFVVCGACQHLNCNIDTGETFACDWCGNTGTLGGFGGDGIASGGDRG